MKISDLVNKVEPFTFEYDGFTLTGEYFKYRTTTPNYAKAAIKSVPEVPENGTADEIEAAHKARRDALERVGAQTLADTVKSWNAEDENGNPLTPSVEVFEQLPEPFIAAFFRFLSGLREGSDAEKKESTPSPSSS